MLVESQLAKLHIHLRLRYRRHVRSEPSLVYLRTATHERAAAGCGSAIGSAAAAASFHRERVAATAARSGDEAALATSHGQLPPRPHHRRRAAATLPRQQSDDILHNLRSEIRVGMQPAHQPTERALP